MDEEKEFKRKAIMVKIEHHRLLRKEAYETDSNLNKTLGRILDEYFKIKR